MALDPNKRKASQLAYYKRHTERIRARKRAYRSANRDKSRAASKAYRETHKEQLRAYKASYNRAYYASHKDEIKAQHKVYNAANRDKRRESDRAYKAERLRLVPNVVAATMRKAESNYRLRHPDRRRDIARKRRAVKRGALVETIDFKDVLRDSNGLCGICGKPLDLFGIEFDHIVPIAKGGTHTRDNIQAAHSRCNRIKGAKVG